MLVPTAGWSVTTFIYSTCLIGLTFAGYQLSVNSQVKLVSTNQFSDHIDNIVASESSPLVSNRNGERVMTELIQIYEAISNGANAFLRAEYTICVIFIAIASVVIFLLISWGQSSIFEGLLTTVSFIFGACTSILCGFLGMRVAIYSNVRTTLNAMLNGYRGGFDTAFRAGSVVGFCLTGLAVLILYSLLMLFSLVSLHYIMKISTHFTH